MIQMQNEPPKDGEEPKTVDQIMHEVLGVRSGYIPGLGYGPKPSKASSSRAIEVEKNAKKN